MLFRSVVALVALTDAGVRQLCASQRVLVFDGDSAKAWGIDTVPWNGSTYAAHVRALMQSLGCYRAMAR